MTKKIEQEASTQLEKQLGKLSSSDHRPKLLLVFALMLFSYAFYMKPLPQNPDFYNFADTLPVLGIPNFWNVVTNLPFLMVGLFGIWFLMKSPRKDSLPYWIYFGGVFLTGLGSSYFHWIPNADTLMWDRLPMTLAFSGFFAVLISSLVNRKWGFHLSWLLSIYGIVSVVYWRYTESIGQGDLRPYGLLQIGVLAYIPLTLVLYREKQKALVWVFAAFLAYVGAKFLEHHDHEVHSSLGAWIGGHPLKHLVAALATAFLAKWIVDSEKSA